MFLTVHSAVGIIIGSHISKPFVAFILGYISHWLLDVIPHGDEKLIKKNKYTASKFKLVLFCFAIIDTLGVIILFLFLSSAEIVTLTTPIFWGMLGAIAPDYLWGSSKIFNLHFLKPLHQIHNWFHNVIKQKIPFKYGAIVQLVTLTILILIIKQ